AASVVWMDARWQDGDIFFSNKSANWTPGNTQPLVINVADRQSDVSGKGNIQFRIGLKESSFTPSPEVPARYAVIALTHTNNTKVQYIYLRQGEGADYVMTGTNAVKWSVYNLGNINGTPGTTPATPVDFPTQGGYFYQWGYSPTDNSPRPYSPVGSISGWTSAAVNTVVKYSLGSISPSGFKLPIVEDFNMLFKCKKAFGYYADGFFDRRQIGTPQSGTPGSNSAVSTGNDGIAYNGCIFINPETNASLFLPVAGYRATAYSGSLDGQGTYGAYWTSVAHTNPGRSMMLFFQLTFGNTLGENANNAFSIRCVK
ncbi:MAG: FISUMP domain-containing protein, partial [Bacteroidales bacterium]